MSSTDPHAWQRTSPLAAVYFLGKLYQAIAKNAVQSLAPLVAFLVAYQGDIASKAILAGSGFVLFTVSAAVLRYVFFRFQVGDESILIRDGVIKKTQLDIKFDRIQAMNSEQTLLFRFFGLTTVGLTLQAHRNRKVRSPASSLSLQTVLRKNWASSAKCATRPGHAWRSGTVTAPPLRTLLRLGNGDIVRTGLSSTRSLIFLAFLAPLLNNVDERIEENIDQNELASMAIQAGELSVARGASLVVLIILAVVAFLTLVSIAGAFLRYHKFELKTDGEQLRSTGGLLTRHEHAMQIGKIQSLHLTQNIAHRLFGRFRLHAKQAASGKMSAAKSFHIPLVKPDQLPGLTALGFADEFGDAQIDPGPRIFAAYRNSTCVRAPCLAGLLPALLVAALFSVPFGVVFAVVSAVGAGRGGLRVSALSPDGRQRQSRWHCLSPGPGWQPRGGAPAAQGAAGECYPVAVSAAQEPCHDQAVSRVGFCAHPVHFSARGARSARLHSLQDRIQRSRMALAAA